MLEMTGFALLMNIAEKNERRGRTEDEFYARFGRRWSPVGRMASAIGFLGRMSTPPSTKMPGTGPGNHDADIGKDQAALSMGRPRPAGANLNCSTSIISVSA
ncbi:hypothetical protein ASD31_19720 [Rhizobium sp. Root482]|nr:hypothetical protein ASD31_19720 [Rhizobium sp. Root482]